MTWVSTKAKNSVDVPILISCEHQELFSVASSSELLVKQIRCDVQFNLQNGKTYGAHSQILTARSPVFAAMFRHDMQENRTKCIDVCDATLEMFKTFLQYMYVGHFAKMTSIEEAVDLYVLADKYQIDDLKELTVNRLSFGVTEENACELFMFADYFSISCLQEVCREIIAAQ